MIDSAGQKLAFVYFEEEPGRRAAAKLLTKDEAHRIAVGIAKLPLVAQVLNRMRRRIAALEKSSRFGHDAPQIRLSKRFAQKRKSPAISRATCQQDY